jgi:structure-specific recognition protein 1
LRQDFERLGKAFKLFYGITLENKEHALRGWNWGKAEFGKAELSFNVQNRPAFEIPYTEVSNTNLAGKNEVSVEFSLPGSGEETGTNGHLGGARANGRKTGGARDQLTEIRFYIPGTTTKKVKPEEGEEKSDEEEDVEEQNAASLFYETLMEKAEIGEVAGDTYATFLDILHLTPRFVEMLKNWEVHADKITEDDLMWTCTKSHFVCAERHTTTRSCTRLSRSSWYCRNLMIYTH